jgi:hypothetical protein
MNMPVSKTMNTLFAASLVLAWSLPAQADGGDPIARCASLATDSDRIACLEAAIRERSATANDTTPAPEPAIKPAPVEPASAAPLPDAEAPVPAKEKFGLKEKTPEAKNAIQVTVTAVRENLRGKLVFETESGQVWLQTGQRSARFADIPCEAEIRPASMGSYFIKATAGGVSIRVRREK